MHIKNAVGINKDPYFVQLRGQESGERIVIPPVLPDSSISNCEIQCSNRIFPRKKFSVCLKYQNTCQMYSDESCVAFVPL